MTDNNEFNDLFFIPEEDFEKATKEQKVWKVIVADDEQEVHEITKIVLNKIAFENRRIEMISAYSGKETCELLAKNPDTAVILLDVVMESDEAGLEAVRNIRKVLKNDLVRIILRTGQPGQAPERSIIYDYDINDYKEKADLTSQKLYTTILTSLRSYRDLNKIIDLNNEIINTQKELILTLGEIVETRSKETLNHVRRVAEFSKIIAMEMGMSPTEAELIKLASPMHDIGKIGIPDSILNKPGKLSAEEFDIIKTHASIGSDILKVSGHKIFQTASIIAGSHHERWDGKGYPNGLAGEEIDLLGRITAVVDVFDALTHERVYKEAWPVDKAIELIKESKGSQFDPLVVDVFLKALDKILEVNNKYPG